MNIAKSNSVRIVIDSLNIKAVFGITEFFFEGDGIPCINAKFLRKGIGDIYVIRSKIQINVLAVEYNTEYRNIFAFQSAFYGF